MNKRIIYIALVLCIILAGQSTVLAGRLPVAPEKNPNLEINVGEIRILMRDAYYPYLVKHADDSLIMSGVLKPSKIPAEYKEHVQNPEMRDAIHGSRLQATLRSTDNGKMWTLHPHALPSASEGAKGLLKDSTAAIAVAQKTTVVKGKSGTYEGKMWVSKDNWMAVSGPETIYVTTPEDHVAGYADGGPGTSIPGPSFHADIIALDNGDLITPIVIHFAEDQTFSTGRMRWRSILVKSTDGGKNWKYVSTIGSMASLETQDRKILDTIPQGFAEPTVTKMANGELLAVIRTGVSAQPVGPSDSYDDLRYTHFRKGKYHTTSRELTQPLYITRSSDNGKTWAKPKVMKVTRGACPRLLTLSNGVVALAYGRIARPTQGNRIIFSADNGRTWTDETDIYPGLSSGYTALVETTPGTILYVFDACTADGPKVPDWVGAVDIDVKLKK